ncbi:MAG: N-acetyl-gamma-glutamyl-phosphate reductase [Planctomycetota bacterium]|nr:MAG: N-acetyl-gamma-glutamyl-phosphate reductase [Planctomycetota bacterium]
MSAAGSALPLVVFGARSYTAGELLRLAAGHPRLRPAVVVSQSAPGACLDELQPHLAGFLPEVRSLDAAGAFAYLAERPDAAVALCVTSGEAAPLAARLDAEGLLEGRPLVDLTGDFRLDAAEYPRWYGWAHPAPALLERFDYCLPELHRERCRSSLVSNPGCFATAVQLACAPALRAGLVEPDLRVAAVTGSSGSGARERPTTHHPARAHDFYAYRPLVHQHTPEVRRGLGLAEEVALALVVHSAPLVRGISATAFFRLRAGTEPEDFARAYREFAAGEPFLRYEERPPRLGGVVGTNQARLAATARGREAVAFCCIDNLCRGASGQALQNLNRVLGLPETLGLLAPGPFPV